MMHLMKRSNVWHTARYATNPYQSTRQRSGILHLNTDSQNNKLRQCNVKLCALLKLLKVEEIHSITENLKFLNMKSMKAIRQARRISLFHSVLEHEELFPTLISSLDTLKPSHDIVTRGANNLNYLTCNTNTFLHSFLIRTARELCTGNIIVD